MIVVSSKPPLAMAAQSSLQSPLSLEIILDDGRSILRRQGSLTSGSSSPKVDWRASGGSRNTIRRAQSVGSALSEFLGSRKSLEENGAMRKSGSRGCLDSLEVSSNARASMDGDDGWSERFEEEREWNFATLDNTLRPGGMLHRDTFPPPPFLSQEWQSFGKSKGDSFRLPRGGTQLKRTASTGGHKVTIPKKSIVLEQAQESFESLKDRLESSLRTQPECSYTPNAVVSLPLSQVPVDKDEGVLGLTKDVGGLNLSALPRSLKRRKHKERARGSCAMSKAFTALVFIIKSMHGHALEMQEDYVMQLLTPMQRDMDLSFAWLFQQVFASTPEYMLSIMTLLADFTVHALGADLALAAASAMASPFPPQSASTIVKEDVAAGLRKELNRRSKGVALPAKQENLHRTSSDMLPEIRVDLDDVKMSSSEELVMNELMAEAMKEMEANAGWQPLPVFEKDEGKKLVAPVQVTISPDNYTCFDRTELEYQHAISSQPTNVMLLSNYAQFLYVVRHDNNRAEEYFHRAIRADPADQEVLGRFATFLWLARGDNETAERAFRAAAALDPTNPHHAGEYSHFLWHSEDSRYSKCSTTCFVGNS